MYRKILVALENSSVDETLITHVSELATRLHSELLLLHVADGFAARNFDQLNLAESEEMKTDHDYLEGLAIRMRGRQIRVTTLLALGDPPQEILKTATAEHCDLIAMGSHGHRFIGDIIHGSTVHRVRHSTLIPVLVVRALRKE